MSEDERQRDERIKAALEALPDRTYRIFFLNMVEKMSHVEIAKQEWMFVWQVRRHMRRAIRAIAKAR
ncbi:sigma-70 family RNA polymerase sigma factor [Sphingobium cupriresistens]|nr:sigma-70 family RNA polymerase sigma factor [Sphingobium cupriresistens]